MDTSNEKKNAKNTSAYITQGLGYAAGVLVYVSAVVGFMFTSPWFTGDGPEFIGPMFVLLLLVLSAAVTGLLVFGRPAYLFLGGFRRQAALLLGSTLAWIVIFIILLAVFMYALNGPAAW